MATLTSIVPRKSLVQAVLEKATGRDLDPVEIGYSNRSEHIGKGYYQTITTRRVTNLRTGNRVVEEERGAIV